MGWKEDQAADWGIGILVPTWLCISSVNLCFLESDFSSVEGGFGLDDFSSQL